MALQEVLEAHRDHHSPLGRRDAHAESDEAQAGGLQDREAALQRREHDHGSQAVREQVAPQKTPA